MRPILSVRWAISPTRLSEVSMRTSELVRQYIEQNGPASKGVLESALGKCLPSVKVAVSQMASARVLTFTRKSGTYELTGEPLLMSCSNCKIEKEAWRMCNDGVCAICHMGKNLGRKAPGASKYFNMYPEWPEAIALNRIINMKRFTKSGLKPLLKELRACH